MRTSTEQGNTPTLPGYTKEEVVRFQDSDPRPSVLQVFRSFWDWGRRPSFGERVGLSAQVKKLLKQWCYIKEKEGLIYRLVQDPHHGEMWQLLVPGCLKEQVLESLHNGMGHQGIERTVNLLKERCFWAGMYEDVESWVKNCERCVLTKMPQPKNSGTCSSFFSLQTS